ncbi:unnamed protein product, partial [Closterium sp. Yama58-4]
LDETLMNTLLTSNVTIFAPTNGAFFRMPKNVRFGGLQRKRRVFWQVMASHLLPRRMDINDIKALENGFLMDTLYGSSLKKNHTNNQLCIVKSEVSWGARVLIGNMYSSPSIVVHAVDTVLLPVPVKNNGINALDSQAHTHTHTHPMAPPKKDAPWRAKGTGVALIGGPALATVRRGPEFDYAMSIMRHPDPIGMGLAQEAGVEAAGEDCLVPGLKRPVIVMGVQVWPLEVNSPLSWKAIEPMARELKTVSKLAEKAIDLMNAPLGR